MLQSLFRYAEATVDSAIANMVARALVAIPFLVAAGFGTAALAIYAYDRLGLVTGNLLLAGAFCLVGAVVGIVVAARDRSTTDANGQQENDASAAGKDQTEKRPLLEAMDRDVLATVASAVGPVALPFVLRSVMRNLPLIAAVAAAGLILSRNGTNNADGTNNAKGAEAAMQPAE